LIQKYNLILRNNNNNEYDDDDDDDDNCNNINLYFTHLVGSNWCTGCPNKLMKIERVAFVMVN